MNRKYELTEETTTTPSGTTLHRIRALRDFGDVKAGDLGGWIESEKNLAHGGECWVYGDAWVFDSAWVYGVPVYSDTQPYSDVRAFVMMQRFTAMHMYTMMLGCMVVLGF